MKLQLSETMVALKRAVFGPINLGHMPVLASAKELAGLKSRLHRALVPVHLS